MSVEELLFGNGAWVLKVHKQLQNRWKIFFTSENRIICSTYQ